MSSEVQIRPYRPGDAVGAARVAVRCFETSIRPYYTPEGCQLFGAYILPDEIAKRQADDCLMVVAVSGGELVGVLELRDFAHLSMFFVDPDFQSCGIGRRLLQRAFTLLRKLHPKQRELTVFSAPGAVDVYRHLGFEVNGEEQFLSGVHYIPMHFLW